MKNPLITFYMSGKIFPKKELFIIQNLLIIHKEKTKEIYVSLVSICLNISARMSWSISKILKLPKKIRSRVLSGLKTLGFASSFYTW